MYVRATGAAALLFASTAHAADCPKVNLRGPQSYTIVMADTAGATWSPPKLKKHRKPKYPDDAYRNRIRGTVLVEFVIDENGCVATARVLRSIPALDAAAVECVSRWRFEPARSGEKAVATIAHAPILFSID